MRSMKRWTVFLACLAILGAACGKPNSIGGDIDLDKIGDASPACRLGECKSPEPSPVPTEKLGVQVSPTIATVAPSKAPDEKFFDVYLVEESPFYAFGPNKELGQDFTMPVGFTLRVKNEDSTDGRPIRSFTAQGAFDSGPMKPGAVWSQRFGQAGTWEITDRAAGFIRAKLTVQ